VVFAIGGVWRKVQFVFNTPISAIEREPSLFIGFICRKVGDSACRFFSERASLRPSTSHHEDLCGEGEVDSTGGDGFSNDAAGTFSLGIERIGTENGSVEFYGCEQFGPGKKETLNLQTVRRTHPLVQIYAPPLRGTG